MKKDYVESKFLDYSSGEYIDFEYISNPSIVDWQNFARRVTLFLVNEGTKEYYSLLKDIVFDFVLIYEFSNVSVDHILGSSGDQYDLMEEYVHGNSIASIIKDAYGADAIDRAKNAIDDMIAYKTGIYENRAIKAFASLADYASAYIKNIPIDDMQEFVNRVNNMQGEITADKILEAYAKSDAIQNTVSEIADRHAVADGKLVEIMQNK